MIPQPEILPELLALPALVLDARGRILRANEPAAQLLGVSKESLAGSPIAKVLVFASRKDARNVTCGTPQDLKVRGPKSELRLVSTRLRRTPCFVALLLGDGGLGAALQARDRAMAEHHTFLNSISHDLRVPLASAAGYISLLSRNQYKESLGADGAYFFDRLRANVEQLDEMLQHILQLSRVGATRRPHKRVRVKGLIEKVIEQFASKIIEVRAQVRVASDLPDVMGDEIQVRRVFQNLIDNAIKFRSEKPLTLEIGYDDTAGALFVRDNGVGIPEALQQKIWEPFIKLDPSKPGSGIGLSLVKRIVEEHDGAIRLESRPGKGSTFFVALPLARS
jgi:signal transduction histidine kinase